VQTADLIALRDVSEGWYVECKQESVKADVLAKSLSALANTYGGWFFLGIEEVSKEHPVAGTFRGITHDEIDDVVANVPIDPELPSQPSCLDTK